ncbi:hypothetical protein BD410DRAFT_740734 [Rickenella mellea]|uniref:Kinetochore protein Spc24 n=1 Tax=Rickenella mellea TaxID=50990 RepID=A0A4Y7QJI6_9AGAM|nr:hypothetical protein BD410DRAFT_740734 [Rickenella mellea]
MMNEIQDAIKVLQDMSPMMDPTDDYLAIAAAEEQMGTTAEEREKELDDAHAQFKALARVLDAARTSSVRPPTVPSEEAHGKILNDMDAMRLSLAKSFNDAEGMLASKEAELARLKEEAARLESSDPAAEHDLDGTSLRLTIFKGMGFECVPGKNGEISKMLIRALSGEIHCVSFDDIRSKSDCTQTIWTLASS